jgi:hypothetical protein
VEVSVLGLSGASSRNLSVGTDKNQKTLRKIGDPAEIRNNIPFPLPGIEPQFPDCPSRVPVTMPELSRPLATVSL